MKEYPDEENNEMELGPAYEPVFNNNHELIGFEIIKGTREECLEKLSEDFHRNYQINHYNDYNESRIYYIMEIENGD